VRGGILDGLLGLTGVIVDTRGAIVGASCHEVLLRKPLILATAAFDTEEVCLHQSSSIESIWLESPLALDLVQHSMRFALGIETLSKNKKMN